MSAFRFVSFSAAAAFFIFLVGASLSTPASAQNPDCPGQVPGHYPLGNFNFLTNSRVDNVPAGQFHYRSTSCVLNTDKSNYVYVYWFIPGPHGWLPPNESLPGDDRWSVDDKAFVAKGCIEYGNRGDTTSAEFFAFDSDKPSLDEEYKTGCKQALKRNYAGIRPPIRLQNMLRRWKIFVPSDGTRPEASMLEINGGAGVVPTSSRSYVSFFVYKAQRYKESQGSIESVTLRPSFAGATEVLTSAFNTKYREPIRLRPQGELSFEFAGSGENFELSYGSYQFFDQSSKIMGSIQFPVFVPAQPR